MSLGVIAGLYAGRLWISLIPEHVANSIKFQNFCGVAMLASVPFIVIGRRFVQKKAEDALRDETGKLRPFILYLRAFKTDVGWHGWFTEPRLAGGLKQFAVPVCVGRPGERLPQFGFHRIYFAEEDWQASVLEMASRAKCMVIFMGHTSGLEWEMKQIIVNRWLPKTVLLVPARGHERHRATLREQHGIDIPLLQSHYCAPYSPGPFDLCPIGFQGTAAVGSLVVPTLRYFPNPIRDSLLIIPRYKEAEWLIGKKRNRLHMHFGLTLEPILKRIDPTYSYKKKWYMDQYR
jgi:hypothetical protein